MGYYADLIKEKKNANDTYGVFEVGGGLVEKCTSRIEADRLKRIWEKRLPKSKFEVDALPRNSKEEKDNASVQDRFRHKGCMITILKKGENQYTFTIEQDGREEGTNATYPTQDKAESEAKREVEVNWNEKEEGYYAKLAEEKASRKH